MMYQKWYENGEPMTEEPKVNPETGRVVLTLQRAKLNGQGVVKRPDGTVRMEEIMKEQREANGNQSR